MPPSPARASLIPLRRLILRASLWLASPLFAAAILFALLGRDLVWILVPLGAGLLVVALGFIAWLVVRARLGPMVDAMERAGTLLENGPR